MKSPSAAQTQSQFLSSQGRGSVFTTPALLACALFLTACGGGGESSPAPIPDIADDIEISSFDDPLVAYQWYLESINAVADGDYVRDNRGDLILGDQVRVATVDTGLEIGHEDIVENLTVGASYNFFNGSNQPTPDTTTGDHGTSVSGMISARGGNNEGMVGVAPSSELRAFKLLNSKGGTSISISDQLAAIGYDPQNNYPSLVTQDLDVFNLSYGFPLTYDPSLDSALNNYYTQLINGLELGTRNLRGAKGALYIKAVGNEFLDIDGDAATEECAQANQNGVSCFNANFETEQTVPYIIPVGAYDSTEKKARFSNTGSALWISAPGTSLLTIDQSGCDAGYSQKAINGARTDPKIAGEDPNCNYFSYFGGSSAATPIVSGSIALILEANPTLTWRDVKHVLATTARQIDAQLADKQINLDAPVTIKQGWRANDAGYTFSNFYGFGALNVQAAIEMATDDYRPLNVLQIVEQSGSVSGLGQIPDESAVGITESLELNQTSNLRVESVRLKLTLAEQSGADGFDLADYVITLISPAGTQSIVLNPFTGFNKNIEITDYPMISHAFYGERLNGEWQLKIQDVDSQTSLAGEGRLVDWSLTFYGHEDP